MKKRVLALLVAATMLLGLTACATTSAAPASQPAEQTAEKEEAAEAEPAADGEKYTIGYICGNPTWQGWLIISSGVTDAAEELKDEVDYKYIGIANSQDFAAYQNAIQDMVTMGCDAIVIGGADTSLAGAIDEFVSNGVTIVEIDTPSGAELTYNMGIDNEAGAKLAAEWMGEALGGKGTVVSINGSQTTESGRGRRAGFVDTIKADYPDIEIFEVTTQAWGQEEALNGIDDAFAALGEIDGVFCAWDGGTVVVQNNLEERGLTGKTLLCGFDGAADALQLMKEGKVDADVAQPLYGMGYEGFYTAYKLCKGEEIGDLKVNLDTKLVLKDDIDSWIEEGHLQSFFEE